MKTPGYTYRARYVRAYDGDTITVDLDLGFNTWLMDQTLRLYGIDTPELRGEERPEGLKVRDHVRARLEAAEELVIETLKDRAGKYGRWLAIVWIDGVNLNDELVQTGRAQTYLP
jgi:micrococcal nuclease